MKFRFHVISVPHTQTVKTYSNCAFTENVRKFCIILKKLGHHVTLYASEDNEAPCDEFVSCISKKEQRDTCGVDGPETILRAEYGHTEAHWVLFNRRVMEEIGKRVQERDFLALSMGDLHDPITQAFPQTIAIEYAVGYTGISQHTKRAFASSAWMHAVYGKNYGAHGTRGRFYDRVIPHYLDLDDFIYSKEKDDYFLFVGRLNEDKGVNIAADVSKVLGKQLVVAGLGPNVPEGADYRGLIGVAERARLMSRAKALFVPSLYLEPFGMVAIEGLACGTPLITTDWGGLHEINIHGVTGYRCNTLQDFVTAAREIDSGEISAAECRAAGERYSIDSVMPHYEKWFLDLYKLWGEGWNTLHDENKEDRTILETDSLDYDVLTRAATKIKGVPGFTCEIGVRKGGGSSAIMKACIDNEDKRVHVGIDPYGNIKYVDSDTVIRRLDYTNDMKTRAMASIYKWCVDHSAEFLFFNMEDTEFFKRYADGVPVYNEYKTILNTYALVHFDGPHSVECIKAEIEFFAPRTPVGGVWVFDDVRVYDHAQIEEALSGFQKIEVGAAGRKISYVKIS